MGSHARLAGSRGSVVAQIRRYHEKVGGFDHLLMMQQAELIRHEGAANCIILFAQEVCHRIRDLPSVAELARAFAERSIPKTRHAFLARGAGDRFANERRDGDDSNIASAAHGFGRLDRVGQHQFLQL